ncbi:MULTISPECIES: molybdenum cofactor biosynthesis protein [unclassified Campylobacter]|uniref:molybdenum cofactor biosynthesis protein n=1 Tax=unclassified Campylobacter TaxID=2593542 RepID=UPI00123837D0|nr:MULTISPECIES: molybdenum cofactor biosynthesis protein [unclassified Campylobacter]KAA6224886.1 molybdenum cofactor biosynthesis protein [Campylobacter sp. LR185c]KAA6226329.1 molybdenum cofactor biosynthesis protein [Campylobacter sp. LR286c]KAA6226821.1 molybdenum cofactor biosynthesis protein [Campylobacter sp. LR196d]KAA6230258.1 molybdenum cofactor biosynthesis protein [Campylobacter sp. LR291e]KAA6233779.1 molybdenum cofactor biosynthesis protein [Campylobacter sp. LR264d]
MFFKKDKKNEMQKPKFKASDLIMDDRLYEFTQKIKTLSKDEASATLLAKQLSRLIEADKI